jgi:hypothetical protein
MTTSGRGLPFRSWRKLQKCWLAIEAAAQRNEPAERRKRYQTRKGCRSSKRPLRGQHQVVMTHLGAILFADISGEPAEEALAKRFYPDISTAAATLLGHLAQATPSRSPSTVTPARRLREQRFCAGGSPTAHRHRR